MPAYQTAILAAEIGSAMTRLTLVDLVDGDFRLVAQVETPTTLAPPEGDASQALLQLMREIETITGREIVRNGRPQIPTTPQGVGVGALAITISAAPPLRVVIAALAAQQSARTAFQAARGSYASVRHVFAIDEASAGDNLWMSRQVRAIAEIKPDLIVVAGGYEGSPTTAMERLGQVIGLVTRRLHTRPTIVYAGNGAAADALKTALGPGVDMEVVPNIRPSATAYRLGPVRAAIAQHFLRLRLPTLRGFERIQEWRSGYTGSVADDQGVMLRFLAERFGRDILALDIGATHSALQIQASGHFSQLVLTDLGTKTGASALLDAVGAAAITRWLPYALTPAELRNRLLNRLLWPHMPPTDLEELLLDHALLREAISIGLTASREARVDMHYDMVIAGGVLARSPHPGYAALTLLDTLLTDEHRSQFAIDLYLDRFGLLATSGALAHINPDAAICLLERDGLSNGPLATVVLPFGDLATGHHALQVELTPAGGEPQRIEVRGGEIARIPLARGQRGTLRIRPADGVRIGPNAPGAEVLSDEAAISGSMLGVIVDARPRPLVLPDTLAERSALLREWLTALGAPLPDETVALVESIPMTAPEHIAATPADEASPAVAPTQSQPASTFLDALPPLEQRPLPTQQPVAETPAPGVHDELDAIRQELLEPAAQPKRGGFFRRKS